MKGNKDLFTSYRDALNSSDKDKLPFERGISALVNEIFWRFFPILFMALPALVFSILIFVLASYSQLVSAIWLGLAAAIALLLTISLFSQGNSAFDRFLKRLFDIFVSVLALIYLSPVLLLIALLIKIDSRGPVLSPQIRLGKGGKEFRLFKFRTMRYDYIEMQNKSSEEGTTPKSLSDLGVTNIGKFLQKVSLDELPQLINVLRGEMSLVGLRPLPPSELNKFDDEYLADYKTVPPGIVGPWQVESPDITYEERIMLDRYYVEYWSFQMDVMILVRMPLIVFNQTSAH